MPYFPKDDNQYDPQAKEIYGSFIAALAITALLWLIAGCAPIVETRYVTAELSHEPRPVLPRIGADELSCVSKDTYQKLYDRQRLIIEYAVKLETIIDSTKPRTDGKEK